MNKFNTYTYPIIGIVLSVFFVLQSVCFSDEPEVTESQLSEVTRAIQGYEETWQSLSNQGISVIYDAKCLYPSFQKNAVTRLQNIVKDSRWIRSKDGDRLFGKIVELQFDTPEKVEKFSDILYYKGQRYYFECNFDKRDAVFQKTTLCGAPVKDADAAYAITQENHDEKSLRFPFSHLLFSFSNSNKVSLKELVNSAKVVSVTTEKNNKGDNLISFKIVPLDLEDLNKDDPPHLSITINTQKSYHVEKVTSYLTNAFRRIEANKYIPIPVIVIRQILEYEQLSDGTFFPKNFDVTNYMGTNLEDVSNAFSTTINFHSIELRPQLPDKLLGFNFPKNALVVSCKKNEKNCIMHIWGENGEPKMTFNNEQEFDSYMVKECGLAKNRDGSGLITPSYWTWQRGLLVLAGMVLIVLAIILKLFAKKNKSE
ncbi:MAG: hypothetical protein LBU65_01790 [Planctomycetaceae bacterium]|jgi:hypothetical protein|nr:hypothetical protein [Planctomycetaceae bacterium]